MFLSICAPEHIPGAWLDWTITETFPRAGGARYPVNCGLEGKIRVEPRYQWGMMTIDVDIYFADGWYCRKSMTKEVFEYPP